MRLILLTFCERSPDTVFGMLDSFAEGFHVSWRRSSEHRPFEPSASAQKSEPFGFTMNSLHEMRNL